MYLDLTGLACYHKKDVPPWYDGLSETARWEVQARFWEAVAGRCAESPAIFCYDLMNEPILPGDKKETEWLAGELGGKFYVQRIALDLAGRTQQQVAKAWVDRLVAAIRKHDPRHSITVGVIPWALVFPGAKPLFYSKEVSENLDFASVHFYPEKGKIEQALTALAVYSVGKPLVIEEMFPLKCSAEELGTFIDGSRQIATGWIGFYWGKTPEEYRRSNTISDALTLSWLELFQKKDRHDPGPDAVAAVPDGFLDAMDEVDLADRVHLVHLRKAKSLLSPLLRQFLRCAHLTSREFVLY